MTENKILETLLELPLSFTASTIARWLAGHEDVERCQSCGRSWDGGCVAWNLIRELQRQVEFQ